MRKIEFWRKAALAAGLILAACLIGFCLYDAVRYASSGAMVPRPFGSIGWSIFWSSARRHSLAFIARLVLDAKAKRLKRG